MAKPVRIFNGTSGLVTKHDPVRLSGENGMVPLTKAVNVDVTDTGAVQCPRPGYDKLSGTGGHSIFCEGWPCLFVANSGYLTRLDSVKPNVVTTQLRELTAPRRKMRYVKVPTGEIYFGNGQDKGVYLPDIGGVEDWIADIGDLDETLASIYKLREQYASRTIDVGEYSEGVEEELRKAERSNFSPLPPSHIEFYRGRLYVAYDRFLLYSQPWQYSNFDLGQNFFPFEARITMIRHTLDGLYVGTEEGVHFLGGSGPDEFSAPRISPYPPVEHTDWRVTVDDTIQGDARRALEQGGDAALWTSSQGIVFGGPGGALFDMTKDRIDIPRARTGTGIVHRGSYVSIMNV